MFYSGDVDFDLFGFGVLALGQMNSEQAILEFRLYFTGVGIIGKREMDAKDTCWHLRGPTN